MQSFGSLFERPQPVELLPLAGDTPPKPPLAPPLAPSPFPNALTLHCLLCMVLAAKALLSFCKSRERNDALCLVLAVGSGLIGGALGGWGVAERGSRAVVLGALAHLGVLGGVLVVGRKV